MMILVTASGPGREHLLKTCLSSVSDYVSRAVVIWPDGDPRPVSDLPMPVEFTSGLWRNQHEFIIEIAADLPATDRAIWMLDDEILLADRDLRRRLAWWAAGQRALPPPLPADAGLPDAGVACAIVVDGAGLTVPHPRIIRGGHRFISWPGWFRPSIQYLPTMWSDIPCAFPLVIARKIRCAVPGAPLRLAPGAGPRRQSTWVSLDHDPDMLPDVHVDLSVAKLPYADRSVDAVYASHMLDHMNIREGQHFLHECCRVLKDGAPIRILVCDLGVFVRHYQDGTLDAFGYFQPPDYMEWKTDGARFGMVGCGALAGRPWYSGHQQLYDGPALLEACVKAGFSNPQISDGTAAHPMFWDQDDIFPDHTLIVEAIR